MSCPIKITQALPISNIDILNPNEGTLRTTVFEATGYYIMPRAKVKKITDENGTCIHLAVCKGEHDNFDYDSDIHLGEILLMQDASTNWNAELFKAYGRIYQSSVCFCPKAKKEYHS